MANNIKYNVTQETIGEAAHTTLSGDEVSKYFEDINSSELEEKVGIKKYIQQSLEDTKLEAAVENTLENQEQFRATSDGVIIGNKRSIKLPSDKREDFIHGLIEAKGKHYAELNKETIAKNEKKQEDEFLATLNEASQDNERTLENLDEQEKKDLQALKDEVNDEFTLDQSEYKLKGKASKSTETTDTEALPEEGLFELLTSGKTKKFFAKITGMAKNAFLTLGIVSGFTGNSKIKDTINKAKVRVYSKLNSSSDGSIDLTKEIEDAEKELAESEANATAEETATDTKTNESGSESTEGENETTQ